LSTRPGSTGRRHWLFQAGALASSVSLPLWAPGASAQSSSALNALPRVALIIGNSNYRDAPLRNPGNDAKDIAGELQKTGFQVTLKLDAGRSEMMEAIRDFGAELVKKKGIGTFFYAGHGAQLAWKNYLVPVDAVLDRIEDIQTKTVELNSLLEGLIKAQNPMNVIILDACRDNPFGNKVHSQQKGLSQFDAPPGSLLAYATSPGNTAADGEGANGLYTENLLREIKVPDAKIEDVFKRVRLGVRRKSNGAQIPWESTSLEDDFYFLPPQHVKKLSEQELEKLFNEELAVWESIKESKEPGPLEDYLRKHPERTFFGARAVRARRRAGKARREENPDRGGERQSVHQGQRTHRHAVQGRRQLHLPGDRPLHQARNAQVRTANRPGHRRPGDIRQVDHRPSRKSNQGRRWKCIYGPAVFDRRVRTRQKVVDPLQDHLSEWPDGRIRSRFQGRRAREDHGAGRHVRRISRRGRRVGPRVVRQLEHQAQVLDRTGIRRPVASDEFRRSTKGGNVIANERRELVAYTQQ
jgi:hypothetical protein